MLKDMTLQKLMETMDWAYDKALTGVPGLDSAEVLAATYLKQKGSRKQQVNALIRWQNAKAATAGFVTGLGGLLTLPLTIPANIGCGLFIQLRMIAAIAQMGGHDVRDDRVKTLAFMCLTGDAALDILKGTGIAVGTKVATNALKQLPGKTLTAINQKVGFRLLTKFGTTGTVNMVKIIPVVGGIIGGGIDLISTNAIGNVARNTFIDGEEPVVSE